jgi:hypothetical protein
MTNRLPIVNPAAVTREVESLPLANDMQVFEAFAFNPQTADYDIWRGTGTWEAIKAAGCRADLSSLMYHPKELLVDGWALRGPARG